MGDYSAAKEWFTKAIDTTLTYMCKSPRSVIDSMYDGQRSSLWCDMLRMFGCSAADDPSMVEVYTRLGEVERRLGNLEAVKDLLTHTLIIKTQVLGPCILSGFRITS